MNYFRNDFHLLQQQQQKSYQYTSANSFAGTAPMFARPHCFRLLYVRILKTAVLSAPFEDENTFSQHISDALQIISNSPGTFKIVRLFILSICFEFGLINNTNTTVIKMGTYILNVLC
jgi:hypothetical protein